MKISKAVEELFATAVALDQSGGLRNTIYVIDQEVYVLNHDHTILLRFKLRRKDAPFEKPISFHANDYDSERFSEEDGKIVFIIEEGDYLRKKSCSSPDATPEDVRALFNSFPKPSDAVSVEIRNPVTKLLDTSLSHIELVGDVGEELRLIQRNIYSGSIIEIQAKSGKDAEPDIFGGGGGLPYTIEPVAVRTVDFMALFTVWKSITVAFSILENGGDYLYINGIVKNKSGFEATAIVSCCIYDEIVEIKEARNGRQEQKVRRRK